MTAAQALTLPGLILPKWTGSSSARSPSLDSATIRAIDRYIADKMRSARIPGLAVAIVQGDRPGDLAGYGSADESGLNFALPVAVLCMWLGVPAWGTIVQFQPDLAYWIVAVAMVLTIKGAVELALVANAYRRTRHAQHRALTHASTIRH